ncbi:MAG: DUF4097 domain-containing protein [Clostridiales bacterium]|nr:DUF4097 domain-containing protein [Clostridiales bacterium]
MNATIQGIIDTMFKDTVNTAETRALHEELLNNCLEHYNDLISRGLSETEAVDAVVESLKGMQEVIDKYPKKPGAGKKEEEVPVFAGPEAEPEKVPEEDDRDRVFDGAAIRRINTELKACDLTVAPSADGKIHVRCDRPECVSCETNGSSLSIRVIKQPAPQKEEAHKFTTENGEINLKGIVDLIGRTLNSVAANFTAGSFNVYLDLPDGWTEELNLASMSGDIDLDACGAEKMTVHSTSGDLKIRLPGGRKAADINAGTMSGDVSLKGNAGEIVMTSMSGEVTAEGEFVTAKIKSTSGDVKLTGCAREVRVASVSGDATVKLKNIDVRDIETSSTSGDVEICVPEEIPGGIHYEMASVSGDTRCRYADAGAGADLKIRARSVSGDVRIG